MNRTDAQFELYRSHCRRNILRSSAAYTLLELMLALALLGALMTVAWSLMGTFRDAELRGWKLAHRTQTIRAAREWLQSDAQHLLQHDLTASSAGTSNARLNGNSMGFTASVAPSIDPLPFLEQVMTNPLANLSSDAEAAVTQARLSLWPPDTMQVEYKLTPLDNQATTISSFPMPPTDPSDLQFSLTRRELLDASAEQPYHSSPVNDSQLSSAPERVLTAQDLYRQTDDTIESSGISIRETRLNGLTNVQFQYFDGISWKREWNSDRVGGLPLAVALVFDFPARADMMPTEVSSAPSAIGNESGLIDSGGLIPSKSPGALVSFADAALAAEPAAESSSSSESSLVQAATHDVQIVVYLGGQGRAQENQQPLSYRARRGF